MGLSGPTRNGTVTLSGTVVSVLGRPVPGAYVSYSGVTVRTDVDGRYTLSALSSGRRALVVAWAPGYRRMPLLLRSAGGGALPTDIHADFSGPFALQSAYRSPPLRAVLHGLKPELAAAPDTVRLSGHARVPLERTIAVTQPSGEVTTLPLHRRGNRFWASMTFPSTGLYWVEIDATSGIALFNVPAFVGVPATLPQPPTLPREPRSTSPAVLESYALDLINIVRRSVGRVPLTMQPQLQGAAAQHTEDMVTHGYVTTHPHIGSDGSTVAQRISRTGMHVAHSGEDVGRDDSVLATIVDFLQSPVHRATLLGRYRWAGIAVHRDPAGITLTADFAG
jgi:uncharacterized protein YkwD